MVEYWVIRTAKQFCVLDFLDPLFHFSIIPVFRMNYEDRRIHLSLWN
jgi:hypothetical protein